MCIYVYMNIYIYIRISIYVYLYIFTISFPACFKDRQQNIHRRHAHLLLERFGIEDSILFIDDLDSNCSTSGLVAALLHNSERAPAKKTQRKCTTNYSTPPLSVKIFSL